MINRVVLLLSLVATALVVINADKRVLENAPGFDKSNWPDMSDTTLRASIYSYYKAEPYW